MSNGDSKCDNWTEENFHSYLYSPKCPFRINLIVQVANSAIYNMMIHNARALYVSILHAAFIQSVTLTLLVCWFGVIGAILALVLMCCSCELRKEELQKRGIFLVNNNFSFGLLFTQSYHADSEDLKYSTL